MVSPSIKDPVEWAGTRDNWEPEQAAAEIIAHAHFHGMAATKGFDFGKFVSHVAREAVKVASAHAPEIAEVGVDLAGEVLGAIA